MDSALINDDISSDEDLGNRTDASFLPPLDPLFNYGDYEMILLDHEHANVEASMLQEEVSVCCLCPN